MALAAAGFEHGQGHFTDEYANDQGRGQRAPRGQGPAAVVGGGPWNEHWRRAGGRRFGRAQRVAQVLRHGFVEDRGETGVDVVAHGAMLGHAPGHCGVVSHRGLDLRAGVGVQLAVGKCHQDFIRELRHFTLSVSDNCACSASRARARRLVSVPTGMSSTCAASL
ncbi:hypothetical protein D3C85_1028430 [compost metagenome]